MKYGAWLKIKRNRRRIDSGETRRIVDGPRARELYAADRAEGHTKRASKGPGPLLAKKGVSLARGWRYRP